MAKYFIGLDNGGSKSKAAIYSEKGEEIAVSGARVETVIRKGGFVERDMNELWDVNAQVIRDVLKTSGIDPGDVAGIAVAGHGNGVYFIQEDGTPVTAGVISTDTRAGDIVNQWLADGVQKRNISKTKQILWAGQLISLIAWFARHEPENLKKARWALPPKDYIRFCLTGEVYGEISDMSATSSMDLDIMDYGDSVLEDMGLLEYRYLLPPLKTSIDVCGHITPEAAAKTGLIEGTPVMGGLFDCAACCIGSGITSSDIMSVIAGTWSINSFISKTPVYSEDLFMTSVFCLPGYYLTTEGSMTSAVNLDWFIKNFLADKDVDPYEICDSSVREVEPEDTSVIFLPFIFGTNVNPDAKAGFIGIDASQNKKHMIRAVFEGVVFSAMMHIEKLLNFTDEVKKIRISGGATNSKPWIQMFSDALQMPIEVSEAEELGALGVAMCASVGAGVYPDLKTAAETMSHVKYTCNPDPELKDIYQKKYLIYKDLIMSLDKIWHKWREL